MMFWADVGLVALASLGSCEIQAGILSECKGLLQREKLKNQPEEACRWLKRCPCLVGIAGEAEQGPGSH